MITSPMTALVAKIPAACSARRSAGWRTFLWRSSCAEVQPDSCD